MINSPKTPDEYVMAELKAIVHFKKRKGDSAVPTGIVKLRERYNATKDRHDVNLKQFLSGRGYEDDEVDRVLSSIVVVPQLLQNSEQVAQAVVGQFMSTTPNTVLPLLQSDENNGVENGVL